MNSLSSLRETYVRRKLQGRTLNKDVIFRCSFVALFYTRLWRRREFPIEILHQAHLHGKSYCILAKEVSLLWLVHGHGHNIGMPIPRCIPTKVVLSRKSPKRCPGGLWRRFMRNKVMSRRKIMGGRSIDRYKHLNHGAYLWTVSLTISTERIVAQQILVLLAGV